MSEGLIAAGLLNAESETSTRITDKGTPGGSQSASGSGSRSLQAAYVLNTFVGGVVVGAIAKAVVRTGRAIVRRTFQIAVQNIREAAAVANRAAETARRAEAAARLRRNKANGDAFEAAVGTELEATHEVVAPQVTIKTPSGTRTRIDYITRDGLVLQCVECKASATAPLTKNQRAAFPEIRRSGGIVVGRGKPGVPGGTVIPPGTRVKVRRR